SPPPEIPSLPDPAPPVGRRLVLQGIGAAAAAALAGCGDSATIDTTGPGASSSDAGATGRARAAGPRAGRRGGGGGAGRAGAGGAGGSGAQGGAGGTGAGSSCTDSGGLTPEQLLAPIKTFVILCMENRSFDHFFGSLSLLEGKSIDGLKGMENNPDPNGMP